MNTMEKLKWLQARAVSVHIEVNDHRGSYHTAAQEIGELAYPGAPTVKDFPSPEVMAACIEKDQLVEARCYPHTPIGFTRAYHYDVEAAIDLLFDAVEPMLREAPVDAAKG